ncbi:MAG: glutamate formiminotransferase / formiminotetrahydrofolate cyclodeaminase [Acidobacteriota bacterium]|nr:glutamate formiminotransferase / formiminotetrahydrofolate cyclodeaminase [Acidobacteriota bacterium]
MKKIVECVPNFSEGRDMTVMGKITDEIKKVAGVELLDVDPGKDTNRTVVTFAGDPDAAVEAAFQAIKKASELIDMSKQHGAHPRMGATDVCPFVPVSGVTMEDCVEIAKKLGQRVAEELHIPVYLYEEAAASEERRSLAYIREGEYEALPEKLKKEEFKPDFGEPVFNARSGATVIGAREFLIAYNVNLNTRDVKIARKIANRIREKGRTVTNKDTGEKEQEVGTLKAVRAVGWYMADYNMAQISVNLLNYKITPLYQVFEECDKFAREFGVRVTGSELVGLIPLEAMLETGRHFLKLQDNSTGVSEKELVRIAVQSLGMAELAPFNTENKIIEYKLRKKGRLASMNLYEFADELASDSPAPGGGSVAALNGSLSAGLSAMVGNLTFGKKQYAEVKEIMADVAEKAQKLKDFFTDAIDKDTEAFDKVMAAFGLPKGTPEETEARGKAVQAATKEATLVPFSVLEKTKEAAELALIMAEKGNRNSLSDAGVAGLTASAAAEGALYNVMINLAGIEDEAFKAEISKKAVQISGEVREIAAKIKQLLYAELKIADL